MDTMAFLISPSRLVDGIIAALTVKSVVDFFIVALLIYLVLVLFKRTGSYFMLEGLLFLLLLYFFAQYLNLYLTSLLFGYFFTFFIIIFVVIFQKELRSFFEWLPAIGRGNLRDLRGGKAGMQSFVETIKSSVDFFSKNKIGAILVFPGLQPIGRFLEKGEALNGDVSTPLLLSIFDTSSPGHDGAVIFRGNKILKFGVHLPLAEHKAEMLRHTGTRHRAALGLAEVSDAFVVVVSEERGTISVAYQGGIEPVTNIEVLALMLQKFLNKQSPEKKISIGREMLFSYVPEKASALIVTSVLWFIFVVQTGTVSKIISVPIEFRSLESGAIVQNVLPAMVNIELSGKNSDFNILNPGDVRVIVDASQSVDGVNRTTLSSKNVRTSGVFSVNGISPTSVRFSIQKQP